MMVTALLNMHTEKTDIEIRAQADSAGGTVSVSAALDFVIIQNRPYTI
jgi:hypothetical protein